MENDRLLDIIIKQVIVNNLGVHPNECIGEAFLKKHLAANNDSLEHIRNDLEKFLNIKLPQFPIDADLKYQDMVFLIKMSL